MVDLFVPTFYSNIYYQNQPNVGKYTIHGSYGIGRSGSFFSAESM